MMMDRHTLSEIPVRFRRAVMAEVFRCGDAGKPFVAYLLKYDEKSQAAMQQRLQDPHPLMPNELTGFTMFAKKPGAKSWVANAPPTAQEYQQLTTPACPEGGPAQPQRVGPSDPDNGAKLP